MRRGSLSIIATLFLALPFVAFADCSLQGYTVLYVNGILTSQADANTDITALQDALGTSFNSQRLTIRLGYNPSHLDGYGDELESASQALGAPISRFDLDTILDQVAPDVTTRKLLLVGHSQGTFYTNELYDYLIANGVPPESTSVYNLATPASTVEGGGAYLTSGNDKLINQVRVWDAEAGAPGPLPANILIPPQPGDDEDIYGGHHFRGDYLAGAAPRIVADIDNSLAKLAASNASPGACFTPPPPGLADMLQKTAFSLADPAVAGIDSVAGKAGNAAGTAASAAVWAGNALTQTVNTAIGDAFFSIFPRPNAQNAGSVFAVEKALYGSSLSEADYEALLQGKDLPEDEPTASQSQSPKRSEPTPVETPSEENVTPPPTPPPILPPSSVPPTPQPFSSVISISPGFGGGGGVVAPPPVAPATSAPETPQVDATSSQQDDQSQNQNQTPPPDGVTGDASSTTATSTTSSSTSTAEVQPPQQQPPTPQSSCGQSALATAGDFFSGTKDDAEYSPSGFLQYHFGDTKNGGFTLTWTYYDDQCDVSGPTITHTPFQIGLPSGVYDWSVRFTSMTHLDIWNDDDGVILGSYDIPGLLPTYSSIAFDASSVDGSGNHSSLVSRGLKIFEGGEPPSFSNSVATPAGCPDITANGYFFDPSYQNAEYVGGLLRVHLRLLAPYNDGRLFRAKVLAIGNDCSFPPPSFGLGPPSTSFTPFIRYYSLRMASSTHWILWDDENNLQIQCGNGCEGDIPDGTSFISFFASIDAGVSTLRTTPFSPTGP
ncbi:MAG TPA: hypothetical protein VMH91_00415 [Candidatus Paceibacterota bacterium]|nr:hypothetical protein [Candidatus Paceibacterota bacterium]